MSDFHRNTRARTPLWSVWAALVCLLPFGAAAAPEDIAAVRNLRFSMKDVEGKARQPFHLKDERASVLIFVLPDCPVANAFAPEIRRIAEAYRDKQVRFALVYVDPDMSAADIRKHRKEYGHRGYPAFFDRKHVLANATGAEITPEAVVIGKGGKVAYRGRINNLYADFGKRRRKATRHDLRDALDEMLAGKPVSHPRVEALGCFIPKED